MKIILLLLIGFASCKAQYDYGEVLRLSLLFYEAQRSGKLPADQKVTWRHDSALNDRGQNGEDLTGGYYDAGDYVKFGFPMAYTATVLAWGVINHQNGYSKANALDDGRKAVKWATDYFLKAHVSENKFYGQVGNGQLDHDYWGRPEEMTMERPAYYINENNPGSDLAGETAAALAAAAVVFKDVDPSYSNTLITHAKQLYSLAINHQGIYSDSITDAAEYYESSDFSDELVWGAAWLYRATNDPSYLKQAEDLYSDYEFEYWLADFNWEMKKSGIEVLLAELTGSDLYINKVKEYCDTKINEGPFTPKGLLFIDEWGVLGLAANAAFLCLEAKNLGLDYADFAKQQIDYMLGDTGRSFVVGYGVNPPTHPHHSSSSCPDEPNPCDWDNFDSPDPNPQILYGALVGGPDKNDYYVDDRSDYIKNEVACDYNAGFQGALAALNEL